jgi:uncharacterized protein YegJ (DUF2314 family)
LNLPSLRRDQSVTTGAPRAGVGKAAIIMSSRHPSGRTAKGYALILGAARAATAPSADGQSVVQKAKRDELVHLALNDSIMAAAIKSARDSLPGFLALAKRPAPEMKGFAVKIALLGDGGPEFFWIHPFAHVGTQFIGQIGNMPRTVEGLKMGDTITFTRRDIVDWMYMDAGKMRGNYSARAILRTALPQDRAAFKRRFGLDFDF